MDIFIITGPPYSGKGTQCEILKKQLNYGHISTGDRCRVEKNNQTEIGKILSEYEEKGNLVPDSIIKDLFEKIIDENIEEKAIILDGYPRTIPQVRDLIDLTTSKGLKIKKVISISVPHFELLNRAKFRAKTSTRVDDSNIKIQEKRIKVFEEFTLPAINFMNSELDFVEIDGHGSIEETNEKIIENLN